MFHWCSLTIDTHVHGFLGCATAVHNPIAIVSI